MEPIVTTEPDDVDVRVTPGEVVCREPEHRRVCADRDLFGTESEEWKRVQVEYCRRDRSSSERRAVRGVGRLGDVGTGGRDAIEPGSFTAAIDPSGERSWIELLFLSFTTLTSTGLSDVVPVKAFARSLSMLEQVAGLSYVAMLVSRLVGLTIFRRTTG